VNTVVEAELVFFPSAYPQRALLKELRAMTSEPPPFEMTIAQAIEAYAAAIARQPWLERFPFALQSVVPFHRNEQWGVRDAANYVLPIASSYSKGWELLAMSGGHPVHLFGEWDGEVLQPLSVWAVANG
jgi:hypothetical protein